MKQLELAYSLLIKLETRNTRRDLGFGSQTNAILDK